MSPGGSPRASVRLRKGREASLLRRHPWVFTGAIDAVSGDPGPGGTVEIRASDGRTLGVGAYSPASSIAVRVWSFTPGERPSREFFRERLQAALGRRSRLPAAETPSARRLVYSEADGLPGLVVDRYDEFLVCQFLSAGVERWREAIVAELADLVPCAGIWERSDVEVRSKEGLEQRSGPLAGREPPEEIEVREGASHFLVDVRRGHKTGMYLDQRDNRARFGDYARGAEVLNVFAYTGGFGTAALAAGAASVTNVETSSRALETARRSVERSGLDPARLTDVEGDAFRVLRELREAGRTFDLVALDPPKFADSKARLERACRGYKDINLQAFALLRPGGVLFTCSCSGLLEPALFQKIVADAALDAGRAGRILERLGQAADHATTLAFPEGAYLKGLVCRVD